MSIPDRADWLLDEYEFLMDRVNDLATEANWPREEGVYYTAKGDLYQLRLKNGWLAARRYDPATKRFTKVYDGMKLLKISERLTREQLIELSITLGICAFCGRTLTAKQSSDRGIGPICYKRYPEIKNVTPIQGKLQAGAAA